MLILNSLRFSDNWVNLNCHPYVLWARNWSSCVCHFIDFSSFFWLVFSIIPSCDKHSRLSSSFISSGEVVTVFISDSLWDSETWWSMDINWGEVFALCILSIQLFSPVVHFEGLRVSLFFLILRPELVLEICLIFLKTNIRSAEIFACSEHYYPWIKYSS